MNGGGTTKCSFWKFSELFPAHNCMSQVKCVLLWPNALWKLETTSSSPESLCLWYSHIDVSFYRTWDNHTQMHTHTFSSTQSSVSQPTVETDRHPWCITLLFISWICHRPRTTGQHLARVTNLHSARCPGWLRTPRLFNFRCDSVITEASCDWNGDKLHKETQTELEREQLLEFYLFSTH